MDIISAPIMSIFKSIDGEVCSNTFDGRTGQGMITTFVRLGGCNLKCRWCDTPHTQPINSPEYKIMTVDDVLREVSRFDSDRLTITGGEPLLQPKFVSALLKRLSDDIFTSLETNGTILLDHLTTRPDCIVMDFKGQSAIPSGGTESNITYRNLELLEHHDWVKCVIADMEDYELAKDFVIGYNTYPFRIAFSVVDDLKNPKLLQQVAERIIADNLLSVTLNIQLHKVIWPQFVGTKTEV